MSQLTDWSSQELLRQEVAGADSPTLSGTNLKYASKEKISTFDKKHVF